MNIRKFNPLTDNEEFILAEELIDFGQPLKKGTYENQCAVWDGDINTPFLGIAAKPNDSIDSQYMPGAPVEILKSGKIWVSLKPNITVKVGDKAYLEAKTGNFTNVATNNLLIGTFENENTLVDEISVIQVYIHIK